MQFRPRQGGPWPRATSNIFASSPPITTPVLQPVQKIPSTFFSFLKEELKVSITFFIQFLKRFERVKINMFCAQLTTFRRSRFLTKVFEKV